MSAPTSSPRTVADPDLPATWRALLQDAARRLGSDLDARRIVEQASGHEGAELVVALDEPANRQAVTHLDTMIERRASGEPLQYVVGRWGFRTLDLYVDARVLIPRPETEVVVEIAVTEARALGRDTQRLVAVDLGTGSGAIALSLAVELPGATVWATEASDDALAVARANLAGTGRPGRNVRLLEGNWFEPLPPELRGRVDLVVANPPYVAEAESLAAEVADWEPRAALIAGPTGLEAIGRIVADAPDWICESGLLVCEIAPHQADAVLAMAREAGFGHVDARPDLAGRLRVLVAHR